LGNVPRRRGYEQPFEARRPELGTCVTEREMSTQLGIKFAIKLNLKEKTAESEK
jgi:hypothetical protein